MNLIASIFAAALSLSSTNDYMFAVPESTNGIRGVGMGFPADYSMLRIEDLYFLDEAIRERTATLHANSYPVYESETNAVLPQVTSRPSYIPSEYQIRDLINRMSDLVWTNEIHTVAPPPENLISDEMMADVKSGFILTQDPLSTTLRDYNNALFGTNFFRKGFILPAIAGWTYLSSPLYIPSVTNVSAFLYGNLARGTHLESFQDIKSTVPLIRRYDSEMQRYIDGAFVTNSVYGYDSEIKPNALWTVDPYYSAGSQVSMQLNSLGHLETIHETSGGTSPAYEGWEVMTMAPFFKGQSAVLKKLFLKGSINTYLRIERTDRTSGQTISTTTNIVNSTFLCQINNFTKTGNGNYKFRLSPVTIEEEALWGTGFRPVRQDPDRPYDFITEPTVRETRSLVRIQTNISNFGVLGFYEMTWHARVMNRN